MTNDLGTCLELIADRLKVTGNNTNDRVPRPITLEPRQMTLDLVVCLHGCGPLLMRFRRHGPLPTLSMCCHGNDALCGPTFFNGSDTLCRPRKQRGTGTGWDTSASGPRRSCYVVERKHKYNKKRHFAHTIMNS